MRIGDWSSDVCSSDLAALEKRLTLWTGIGIAGMLAPGLVAWNEYVTVPKEAAVIEATGQQWSWSFRLPGNDGVLGTADIHHIGVDNPFGLNPNDPYGQTAVLVEASVSYLPVGRPVKVLLRSKAGRRTEETTDELQS